VSPSPPAVSVRGLVKRYGRTTAVDGLDLELPAASVLALLGPNGAGKTTTVEVCEGFVVADAGEVRVLGVDPAGAPDALRARIGVMPQGGGAYPGVHAGEMLRVVAACAAHPLDVGWLSEVLGLDTCGRTPYKRLSGGQQQRLALACAVVGRPELVFLDEPTAGMDPQGRRLVWDLISALRRDGVAVLLTTHLMEEAEALADDVVIVDHGRVVAHGTPAALTAGEQHDRYEQGQQHLLAVAQREAQLGTGLRGQHPARRPRAGTRGERAGDEPTLRRRVHRGRHARSSRPVSSRNTSSRLRRATCTSSASAPCSAHHEVITDRTVGSIRPCTT